MNVQPKPISNMIDVGAQVQQVINVECRGVFFEPVLLEIKFQSYVRGTPSSRPQTACHVLQVHGARYHDVTGLLPEMETAADLDTVFSTVFNEDPLITDSNDKKQRLAGFGFSVLEGVDPNPANCVSAGVINTSSVLIGCLLRLEPNIDSKMYRLTVRTSNDKVTEHLCSVLSEQF
ncbi:AP-2 complex subunit alpha-2 [Geodia barretti]|uniref:AP-2 complex subunit alpha-2 n=1 Tax=Geodia barretti TaxID=519541 RepID=A0AA35RPT9_GEOBA|nr:AP-2 complex subunit alpha-2 [Geodia barretti]